MAEQVDGGAPSGGNGQDAAAQAQQPLVVNAQYIKDLSFEVPNAPHIFAQTQNHQPDIQIKVDVEAHPLGPNIFEVVLNLRADCKAGEQVAFVVELAYGGVFTVNVAENLLQPVVLIECPRMLFPFARQILATTTVNGGFMPLMIGPIDFVALYQQQQQRAAAGNESVGEDVNLI